jgi:energy-coupling factor transporter ATP-binding protein EcfA2
MSNSTANVSLEAPMPILLITGQAGAGKSTLITLLSQRYILQMVDGGPDGLSWEPPMEPVDAVAIDSISKHSCMVMVSIATAWSASNDKPLILAGQQLSNLVEAVGFLPTNAMHIHLEREDGTNVCSYTLNSEMAFSAPLNQVFDHLQQFTAGR